MQYFVGILEAWTYAARLGIAVALVNNALEAQHIHFCEINRLFFSQIFNGNDGRNDIVKHNLEKIARARFIRFQPIAFHTRKALRVEVYGLLQSAGNSMTLFLVKGCRTQADYLSVSVR